MSPQEFAPLAVTRPRLQPNQVDEWTTTSLDYGLKRQMSCRLTLCCGHQIPLAVNYPVECDAERYADTEARRKLNVAITQHVVAHDCATYVRIQTLARITRRLKS